MGKDILIGHHGLAKAEQIRFYLFEFKSRKISPDQIKHGMQYTVYCIPYTNLQEITKRPNNCEIIFI